MRLADKAAVHQVHPAKIGVDGTAFLIGTIEIFGLLIGELSIHGGFWDFIANFDINKAGFAIAGLFVAVWAAAIAYRQLAKLDHRWALPAQAVTARAEPLSSQ